MPAATRGGLMFDLGTAVHTAYDDEGWIGVRLDGYGEEESGMGDSELQTQFGFTSRPVDRDDAGGCDILYAHAGNSESFAWLGTDRRYTNKCPPLFQGSSAQWNSHGGFFLLDTEQDTATLYVPMGNEAHVVTVGVDANAEKVISLQHSNGSYITVNKDGITMRGVGDAFANINGNKVALNGEVTTTASMTVGGVAALSVAKADPIVAYLSALEALLGVMAVDIAAKTPIPAPVQPPASAAAVTAFATATAALKVALKAQMLATV